MITDSVAKGNITLGTLIVFFQLYVIFYFFLILATLETRIFEAYPPEKQLIVNTQQNIHNYSIRPIC